MRERFTSILSVITHPVIALGGAVIIAVVAVAIALQMSSVAPSGQFTQVALGPITAVGGANSDLSFQIPGQVVAIPVTLGQTVSAGDPLVRLDQSSLLASRAVAAANLEAASARLAALQAGTRPEQIALNQTSVVQAEESLRDVVKSAYVNADDAVHYKTDQFFTNPHTPSAALNFIFSDQTLQNSVQTERVSLESALSSWGAQVNAPTFASSDPIADAKTAQGYLSQVSAFLDDVAAVLARSSSSAALPLATLQGYQTGITAARLSVSGSVSAITGATTALQSARGQLTLAQAGATVNDVAAAQATVDAAQAALRGIDVTLRQSTITAPFAGTITRMDAHLGQTVSPGQVLVSIESTGGTKQSALVVPTSSIIENDGQAFVYAKNGGAAVKTPVTTGLVSSDGVTEITSGLSTGDSVLMFGGAGK